MIMYRKRCYVPETVHDHGMASGAGAVQRWRPGAASRGGSPGRVTVAVVPGGTSRSSSIDRPLSDQDTSMGPNGLMCLAVAEVIPLPGRGRTSKVRYPGEAGRSPATEPCRKAATAPLL